MIVSCPDVMWIVWGSFNLQCILNCYWWLTCYLNQQARLMFLFYLRIANAIFFLIPLKLGVELQPVKEYNVGNLLPQPHILEHIFTFTAEVGWQAVSPSCILPLNIMSIFFYCGKTCFQESFVYDENHLCKSTCERNHYTIIALL